MIRLTGGTFRGRSIQTPHHQQTRPTQAKLRQALFNSLQAHVSGARVLDLFAGSGSLGFEALSRGAEEAVFVEVSKPTAKLIQKNSELLAVQSQTKIVSESVDSVLPKLKSYFPFDLVVADPPYFEGWEKKLLDQWPWDVVLAPGGLFCLEWGLKKSEVTELPERLPHLVKIREKNYGDSMLTTYVAEGNGVKTSDNETSGNQTFDTKKSDV